MPLQPTPRSTRGTRDRNRQLCIGLDLGGTKTLATYARRNSDGKVVKCTTIARWPRSPGPSQSLPTLVATSKKRGEDGRWDKILWGYEAETAVSDDPDGFDAHKNIKSWLLNDTTPASIERHGLGTNDDDMYLICLFFLRNAIECVLESGDLSAKSLLLYIAVPVGMEETNAHRYLKLLQSASPVDDTKIRVHNEAMLGGLAVRERADDILEDESRRFDEFRFVIYVDFGSFTTDVSIFDRTRVGDTTIYRARLLESSYHGSGKINQVILDSHLPHSEKMMFEKRLEAHKEDLPEWQRETPSGPKCLESPQPVLMRELVTADADANEARVGFIKFCCDKILSGGTDENLIIAGGGGAGSKTLQALLHQQRTRFGGQHTRLITKGTIATEHQYVLEGLQLVMQNPSLAIIDKFTQDVFLQNHTAKSSPNAPVSAPIKLFKAGDTSSGYHKRIIFDLEQAHMEGDNPPDTLLASFQLFTRLPAARRGSRSRKRASNRSKNLKDTGTCDVELRIAATNATIYVYVVRVSSTLIFGIVHSKDGQPDEYLERDKDIFEGDVSSGRLSQCCRERGFVYLEVERVTLPHAETSRTTVGPLTKKRKRGKASEQAEIPELVIISDDDDEDVDGDENNDDDRTSKEVSKIPKTEPHPPTPDVHAVIEKLSSDNQAQFHLDQLVASLDNDRVTAVEVDDHLGHLGELLPRLSPHFMQHTGTGVTFRKISENENLPGHTKKRCENLCKSWEKLKLFRGELAASNDVCSRGEMIQQAEPE